MKVIAITLNKKMRWLLLLLFTVPQRGGAPDVRGVQAEDWGTLHRLRSQMDDLCPD